MTDAIASRESHVFAALKAYRKVKRSKPPLHSDDLTDEIVDFAADLLHYARSRGMDTDSILRRARMHATAERQNREDARAQGLTGADLDAAINS